MPVKNRKLSDLLWAHIFGINTGYCYRRFHGIPAEGFAEFLVKNDLYEGCDVLIHLLVNGRVERVCQAFSSFCLHAFDSASFRHFRVLHANV